MIGATIIVFFVTWILHSTSGSGCVAASFEFTGCSVLGDSWDPGDIRIVARAKTPAPSALPRAPPGICRWPCAHSRPSARSVSLVALECGIRHLLAHNVDRGLAHFSPPTPFVDWRSGCNAHRRSANSLGVGVLRSNLNPLLSPAGVAFDCVTSWDSVYRQYRCICSTSELGSTVASLQTAQPQCE